MKNKIRIYYDEEGDYFTLFSGEPKPNYGEDIASGVTVFKDEETEEIIGIGILNFRTKTRNLRELELKLPFRVDFSSLKI